MLIENSCLFSIYALQLHIDADIVVVWRFQKKNFLSTNMQFMWALLNAHYLQDVREICSTHLKLLRERFILTGITA